jgi:hypothetical protein
MRALRRRRRGENGAVAVEAALVMPLLCLMVFGIIEFSLLMRDYAAISNATRVGVRTAATGAAAGPGVCETGPTAPPCTSASSPKLAQSAADTMADALTGVPPTSVDYVLVYEANSKGYPCLNATSCPNETGTTMPDTCVGYANCVKFVWNLTTNSGSPGFRYSNGAWKSADISACVNKQDAVGIYLKVTHAWTTGLFGKTIGLADRSVAKFEPLPDTVCSSTAPVPHS